jgi:hypothetical protein
MNEDPPEERILEDQTADLERESEDVGRHIREAISTLIGVAASEDTPQHERDTLLAALPYLTAKEGEVLEARRRVIDAERWEATRRLAETGNRIAQQAADQARALERPTKVLAAATVVLALATIVLIFATLNG